MKGNYSASDNGELRDIRNVVIDTTQPCSARVKAFVEQIGNPYRYLDNGVIVEVGYADTDISLQDRLSAYASSMDHTAGK